MKWIFVYILAIGICLVSLAVIIRNDLHNYPILTNLKTLDGWIVLNFEDDKDHTIYVKPQSIDKVECTKGFVPIDNKWYYVKDCPEPMFQTIQEAQKFTNFPETK